MARALNLLRSSLHYRRDAFNEGLRAAGYKVVDVLRDPKPGDLLVSWNRYGGNHELCLRFERAGAGVLVVENGLLGKRWRGGEWFSLALWHHAGAGDFKPSGPERWDGWNVPLDPWREGGHETLIFGQRGIGEPGHASPPSWAEDVKRKTGARIRPHPGGSEGKSLDEDLAGVREALTWNSSAGLQALLRGVPVWYDCPSWIGAGAARPLSKWPGKPLCDDAARLATFRRLAYCMWTLDEVRTGEPIARLK